MGTLKDIQEYLGIFSRGYQPLRYTAEHILNLTPQRKFNKKTKRYCNYYSEEDTEKIIETELFFSHAEKSRVCTYKGSITSKKSTQINENREAGLYQRLTPYGGISHEKIGER